MGEGKVKIKGVVTRVRCTYSIIRYQLNTSSYYSNTCSVHRVLVVEYIPVR